MLARVVFDLPGGAFHALRGGRGARTGSPVLYLHGFPDHPPTAKPFLEAIAATREVIAPWLRGYAPSPRVPPYDLDTLVDDVLGIADRVSAGPLDVVGHDWGAVLGYLACQRRPDRFRRAAMLAVPHPRTLLRQLAQPAQLARSAYIALFQLPGAGAIVRRTGLVDRLWRRWSPGLRIDSATRDELHACLDASWPAPLEYYRQAARPLHRGGERLRALEVPLEVPILQLHGADDGCIAPWDAGDDRYFARREREVLPGLGHFLQVEAPELVASRITSWLDAA